LIKIPQRAISTSISPFHLLPFFNDLGLGHSLSADAMIAGVNSAPYMLDMPTMSDNKDGFDKNDDKDDTDQIC